MNKWISRRDFLKLTLASSLGLFISPFESRFLASPQNSDNQPNIFIFLFDTLSARHLSLHGYPRDTTPNLNRFANRANVYHRHYAGGNYTTPGTASLLTGSYPWTHRAIVQSGLVSRELIEHNLFRYFGDSYSRLAFSQNLWSEIILKQFGHYIDQHLNPTDFSLVSDITYSNKRSRPDPQRVYREFDEFLFQHNGNPASLVFSFLKDFNFSFKYQKAWDEYKDEYPRGIPNLLRYHLFFLLEQTFDGVISQIAQMPKPGLAYFHFYSPHEPYFPRREFIGRFDDNWIPVSKPFHPLGSDRSAEELNRYRREYDEYIANVDSEFGRLLDFLDQSGHLENSYVIVTSDHGQAFERGVHGHTTPLLFDPLIHIPLVISSPGQTGRNDFYAPTSCVDVLLTLLKITGRSGDGWGDGVLLPGFGGEESMTRAIYSVEASSNPIYAPLLHATVAMMKGEYKLIWYGDYPEYRNVYEFYNVKEDPEELTNLSKVPLAAFQEMRAEMEAKLVEVNKKYSKK